MLRMMTRKIKTHWSAIRVALRSLGGGVLSLASPALGGARPAGVPGCARRREPLRAACSRNFWGPERTHDGVLTISDY